MTWTERSVSGITTGTITDIQFANDMIGFFIHNTSGPVGRIYRTINGGYSWQAQELVTNAGLNASSVIGDNQVFAVGEASGGTAVIGNNVKIYPNCFIGDNVSIGDNCVFFAGDSVCGGRVAVFGVGGGEVAVVAD